MLDLLRGYHQFHTGSDAAPADTSQPPTEGLEPPILLMTGADPRVRPEMFAQQTPGRILVMRNAGNIVPAFGADSGSVSATLEYAMRGLEVCHVVVLGHTECDVMRGLLHPEELGDMPEVESWVQQAESARLVVEARYPAASDEVRLNRCIETHVLTQIGHLVTHPSVAERVAEGALSIFGWVLDISAATISQYNPAARAFLPLEDELYPVTPIFA